MLEQDVEARAEAFSQQLMQEFLLGFEGQPGLAEELGEELGEEMGEGVDTGEKERGGFEEQKESILLGSANSLYFSFEGRSFDTGQGSTEFAPSIKSD